MPRFAPQALFIFLILACGTPKTSKKTQDSGNSGDLTGDERAQDKPQMIFISPTQDLTTDQDVDVQVKFTGNTKKLRWNLYFIPVDLATKDETPIALDQEARDTKITWNTATVSPGTYRLVGVFSSSSGKGRTQSKARIEIKEGGRPTVTITAPSAEKVLLSASTQQILFKGEDPNGAALEFKIEVSSDNGKTWSLVTDGLTKSSFSWDIKKLPQGTQYKLKVSATNARGLTGSTIMTKPFGIAPEPITYATKIAALLAGKCGSCHAIGGPNAQRFRSDSFDLATTGVSAKADAIKKRTLDGTMPPTSKLTSAELDLITLWHWTGAQ